MNRTNFLQIKSSNIIRTDIADDIKNKMDNFFIILYGNKGSGKTYIANHVARNLERKQNKKLFFNKCVSRDEKENENQIYDYESFLSNTLLKFMSEEDRINNKKQQSLIITADVSIDTKEERLKQSLSEGKLRIIFVFDDFEKLTIDDRDRIFNFLENNIEISKHSVIFTSSKTLDYYSIVPHKIYEKEIGMLNHYEFKKICEKYIKSMKNKEGYKKLYTSLKRMRNAIGKEKLYDFVFKKSGSDLCLMKDILLDFEQQIKDIKKKNDIRAYFRAKKRNYSLQRGDLLEKFVQNLNVENEKKVFQLLSFFEKPISFKELGEKIEGKEFNGIRIDTLEKKDFEDIESKEIRFDDYIKIVRGKKEETKYFLSKILKDLLEEERDNYSYKMLIDKWIGNYKKFTKEKSILLDEYLNGLKEESKKSLTDLDDDFDNITRVLNYCYKNCRWKDYYEISEPIWYYCELKNKDINVYHYKRFEVAKKLKEKYVDDLEYKKNELTIVNDLIEKEKLKEQINRINDELLDIENKIFESGLHYCNIACKMGAHTSYKVQKCFQELKKKEKNIDLFRLKIKLTYTLALRDYANKEYDSAERKFNECEESLPIGIKKEELFEEKKKLMKDYVSSVRWHAICFYNKICNRDKKNIRNYVENNLNKIKNLINTMNDALDPSKYDIDYKRVRSSILVYKVKLLLLLYIYTKDKDSFSNNDEKKTFREQIVKSYNSLKWDFEDSVIRKDVGLSEKFDDLKNELMRYIPI